MATTSASTFRRREPEITLIVQVRLKPDSTPEMLVPSGHLTSALIVTQQHITSLGHHADPGYRQIAGLPTHAAKPPPLRGPRREQQLVVVARGHRSVQLTDNRNTGRIDRHANAGRFRN